MAARDRTPDPASGLVPRLTWNRKASVSFLSVRKWPRKDRRAAIHSFKAAKKKSDRRLLKLAAREIVLQVGPWLGPNVTVTAPPAGASAGQGVKHFATELAREVARLLKADFAITFKPRLGRSSSYPKRDEERGPMDLAVKQVCGIVLLVDDVATSGTTLERATAVLRAAGAGCVIPVTWIYGTAGRSKDRDGLAKPAGVADGVFGAALSALANKRDQRVARFSDESVSLIVSLDDLKAGASASKRRQMLDDP